MKSKKKLKIKIEYLKHDREFWKNKAEENYKKLTDANVEKASLLRYLLDKNILDITFLESEEDKTK